MWRLLFGSCGAAVHHCQGPVMDLSVLMEGSQNPADLYWPARRVLRQGNGVVIPGARWSPVEMWRHTATHGRGREGETGEWSWYPLLFTLPRNMVYPALLPLMRTPRLSIIRLNWRPRRFKRTRPFRRKTKSGFCACAIPFQTQSTIACARAQENVELQRDAFSTGRVLETVVVTVYRAKENTDGFTSVGVIRPCGPVHRRDVVEKEGISFLSVNHNSWLKVYECNALL